MNIFENFIPHKTKKFDYKTPEWMNSMVISSLKKRKKLAKIFYKNPSDYNKNVLFDQANKCTKSFSARTKNFETSFYPYCLKEWSNLSEEICNIVSLNKFKKTILNFIRPKENSVFAIHVTNGIKLLTRLRLNFTHLNEHKFRHGFRDMIDPMCKCGK